MRISIGGIFNTEMVPKVPISVWPLKNFESQSIFKCDLGISFQMVRCEITK